MLRVCTYCGNAKWNLELNPDKGFYSCWSCRAGGRLDFFLKQLTGKDFHVPVRLGPRAPRPEQVAAATFQSLPVAEVLSAKLYLERRGLSVAVATSFGLRVCVEKDHLLYGRLVIPACDFYSGEILGWVGRSYSGGHPKYLSTLETRVVTGWRSREPHAPVVVVEGHMDGLAVRWAGYSAAVLGGTDSPGVVLWVSRLPPQTRVVVMLDATASAEAERVYWELSAVHGAEWVRKAQLAGEQDPSSIGPDGIRQVVEYVWPAASAFEPLGGGA